MPVDISTVNETFNPLKDLLLLSIILGIGLSFTNKANDLAFKISESAIVVTCSHSGYMHLPGSPIHTRNWHFRFNELVVHDQIVGSDANAVARFYLHPTISQTISDDIIELQIPNSKHIVRVISEIGRCQISSGRYAPEFGKSIETKCIEIVLVKGESKVRFLW